jgi:prolycopene isomerase
MFRAPGIADRLRLHRLDPLYVLRGGGPEIIGHGDAFQYESQLLGIFPEQAEGIRAYLDEALAVYRDTRRLEVDITAGRGPGTPEDMTRHYPAMVRVSGETWEQMMMRHVGDQKARAALSALWSYTGLPPSRCSAVLAAVLTASYQEHGGWYPEGGAQSLTHALEQTFIALGGEIRCGQLVNGFEFSDGHAVAVTTRQGQRVAADVFISNASAPSTMLDLVGPDHLPSDYVRRVEQPTPSLATFSVFLGLDRDLFGEQGLPHELLVDPSYDPEDAWQAAQSGDWDRTSITLSDYTRVDPGCAPAGHGVVVLTAIAPWDYADTWGTGGDPRDYHRLPRYLALKEQVAETLVARADVEVPGLKDAIVHQEAATPLTSFHYTLNPKGAIEGYENSPANSGLGLLPQDTPVRNIFLAGAWTNAGGMNPAMESEISAAARAPALLKSQTAKG